MTIKVREIKPEDFDDFIASIEEKARYPSAFTAFARHIGDAVYADFDGHHVVLTVDYGSGSAERIYLDSQAVSNLENFILYLRALKGINI